MGPAHCVQIRDASLCTAVVFECLRCMYDSELVIRTAALASLKKLMELAACWSGIISTYQISDPNPAWMENIKVIVMPGLRRGLKHGSDIVKKGFIQLLSHVVRVVGIHCTDPNDVMLFHTDLFFLSNSDAEQDFFENICHIQLHRRSRIMSKLTHILSVDTSQSPIGNTSLVHVLLPIALHPLISNDFTKKEHAALLQDAATLAGSVARHLSWSQYSGLVKFLLKILDNDRGDKEKILLTTLCAILDSFHFDMTTSCEQQKPAIENTGGESSDDEDEEKGIDEDLLGSIPAPQPSSKRALPTRSISAIVITSIIPSVKSYLIKHGKDHTGNKTETVRTPVAVALCKLLRLLEPPVLSEDQRNTIFTNLVMNIVNTLKSRDSAARDLARDSLSQMVLTMGMSSLYLVLSELHHSLGEGYQRHVRNYTVKSILAAVLEGYSPPSSSPILPLSLLDEAPACLSRDVIHVPEFDRCIPLIMDFCLDEIYGKTHDDRSAEGAVRTLIREAKGNKANEILELCGKSILFRPSYALTCPNDPASVSSVHALVTPLLEALKESNEVEGGTTRSVSAIGRASESLQRISIGLSKNASMQGTELLLYLHATLQPFVSKISSDLKKRKHALGRSESAVDNNDDEDLTSSLPSYLREESSDEEEAALYSKKKQKVGGGISSLKANTWLPFERSRIDGQREAIRVRDEERHALIHVEDGVHAPKLTGRNKYKAKVAEKSPSEGSIEFDPAFNNAVKFCLSLLLSCIKLNKLDGSEEIIRSMATPFLPLFGQCLRLSGNSGIVVLALRCICSLLNWGLPVEPSYSRAVGKRMLEMMYKGGAVLSTDSDLVQTCIKGLVSLFQLFNKTDAVPRPGDQSESKPELDESVAIPVISKRLQERLPLDIDSIRSLLSLLAASILEVTTGYQNSAFQLIRMIADTKIVVPEMYDVMNHMIDQIVVSHRKGVRESASSIATSFILTYPLSKKRLDSHMKQFIQNCSFEFEEGRLSALSLLNDLCRLLPLPVLDDYTLIIFMPMAVQLVSDSSPKCRSSAADVIVTLMRRCSSDLASQCLQYSFQWLGLRDEAIADENQIRDRSLSPTHRPLMRTGAQIAGLIALGRPDMFKRGKNVVNTLNMLLVALTEILNQERTNTAGSRLSLEKRDLQLPIQSEIEGDGGGLETWALLYHLLMLLERIYTQLPKVVDRSILQLRLGSQDCNEDSSPTIMGVVLESLLFPHAWVRAVSCRVLAQYLRRRDATQSNLGSVVTEDLRGGEILLRDNALYHLARRLCIVINYPVISSSLLPALVECLCFAIRAMYHHPDLVSSAAPSVDPELVPGENDDSAGISNEGSDTDSDAPAPDSTRDQLKVQKGPSSNWVMQRLRGIGADSRGSRRYNVIKVSLRDFFGCSILLHFFRCFLSLSEWRVLNSPKSISIN
jgi:hypothetical protein